MEKERNQGRTEVMRKFLNMLEMLQDQEGCMSICNQGHCLTVTQDFAEKFCAALTWFTFNSMKIFQLRSRNNIQVESSQLMQNLELSKRQQPGFHFGRRDNTDSSSYSGRSNTKLDQCNGLLRDQFSWMTFTRISSLE